MPSADFGTAIATRRASLENPELPRNTSSRRTPSKAVLLRAIAQAEGDLYRSTNKKQRRTAVMLLARLDHLQSINPYPVKKRLRLGSLGRLECSYVVLRPFHGQVWRLRG
jgi:hypothetical protein